MKQKITLLMMALLLAVSGMQAQVKTFEFKFTDSEFNVSYTGTNSVTTATGELSLAANATCAWDRYWSSPKYDLSSSDIFVVKLKEAATQDLFVMLSTDGFWGTVGENGTGYIATLAAGQTELSFPLSGLKNNQEGKTKYGETIDLTKINMINLWTGGAGGAYTYKIDAIYAAKYDKLIEDPVWTNTSFTLSDENFKSTHGDGNTVNTGTNTVSLAAQSNSMGWEFDTPINLTEYDKLVIRIHPQGVTPQSGETWYNRIDFCIDTPSKESVYTEPFNCATNNPASYFTRIIDLKGTLKGGENHDGDVADVSSVSKFRLWASGGALSIQIDEIYLMKAGSPKVYLCRKNTTASKYGTICLPFAASKPSNATVYDVVGYSEDNDAPKNVYLRTVDALEAGKAYLFKSSDDKDITFIKTGSDANLDSPATPSDGLIGYFDAATRYVPQNSYILVSGKWKKVTKENQNQVGLYRGYLTLSENLKVTPAAARSLGYLEMDMYGSETTGIADVRSKMSDVKGDCYDLQGCKVANPTKGLYIVNGKKVVLK